MATWTELLERATPDSPRDVDVSAVDLRELLIDLPNHPNVARIRSVTLEVNAGMAVRLLLPADESMTSGASGPIEPGAGVQRDTVQPWRVTPVLGDAGEVLNDALRYAVQPEPFAPPPVETAPVVARSRPVESEYGSSMPVGAGWLEGITYEPGIHREPGGDHCFAVVDAGPREKRSPGGIILETT